MQKSEFYVQTMHSDKCFKFALALWKTIASVPSLIFNTLKMSSGVVS